MPSPLRRGFQPTTPPVPLPRSTTAARSTRPEPPATMSQPPPPRSRHSPPALVDDAIHEILLRIPPEDPADLVRAAAVCTTWRRTVSDPAFCRDYRAFHGTPPMLGFLLYTGYKGHTVSRFVRTTPFKPPGPNPYHRQWYAIDSRHGRVLFYTYREKPQVFLVWDPITDDQWRIPSDPKYPDLNWNAAVLCADDGCDHLSCHGGPFLVAFVASDDQEGLTFACVYSSETGEWSDQIVIEHPGDIMDMGHSVVVGKIVYFPYAMSREILRYNMGEQELSVIYVPPFGGRGCIDLITAEDGMLVFASVMGSRLYLWSMEAGPNGAVAWAQRRQIKLLLPHGALSGGIISVVGLAHGVGVIFVVTEAGLFTVQLNSGQTKRVSTKTFVEKVIPYISFYTQGA